MVKEVEDIDSSVCWGSELELLEGALPVFQIPNSTPRAFKPKVNFGVFNVNSVQRGLEDERHPTSN